MKVDEIVSLATEFANTLRKPCPDGHIPEVWEKASDEMVKEVATMCKAYTAWLTDRYFIVPKEKVSEYWDKATCMFGKAENASGRMDAMVAIFGGDLFNVDKKIEL